MELHNYYTLKTKSGVVTAFNSATIMISKEQSIKYLTLYNDDEKVLVLPTTLLAICDDVTVSNLKAVYSVEVDSEITFNKITLSCDEEGERIVSIATLPDRITTNALDPMSVTVTVFLIVDGSVKLCGGNNPLARWLLGASEFPSGVFAIASSAYSSSPNKPITRSSSMLSAQATAQVEFLDNSVTFTADVKGDKQEFVLLYNYVPVARVVAEYPLKSKVFSVRQYNDTTGLTTDKTVTAVAGITIDGTPTTVYSLKNTLPEMLDLTEKPIMNTGVISSISVDANEEYLLITTANELFVICPKYSANEVYYRAQYQGGAIYVTAGGDVAVFNNDKLTLHINNNGKYTVKQYDFNCSIQKGKTAIVKESIRYHVARVHQGLIERFALRDDEMTLLSSISETSPTTVVACDGVIINVSKTLVEANTSFGGAENFAKMLKRYINDFGYPKNAQFFSRFAFGDFDWGGIEVVNYYGYSCSEYDYLDYIGCDNCYVLFDGGSYILKYVDRYTGVHSQLTVFPSEISDVKSAVVVGNVCYVLNYEGKLFCYSVLFNRQSIISNTIKNGSLITYTATYKDIPHASANETTKITISICG